MQEGTPIIIKKKKAHSHGHHGGAWKVAYADFVTAMMAFFLVMWIMSLSQDDRNIVQAYFRDPVGFSKEQPLGTTHIKPPESPSTLAGQKNEGNALIRKDMKATEQMENVRKQIVQQLQDDPEMREMLKNQSIEMQITTQGLKIEFIENELNGEVFFEVGQAVVRPKATEVILKIAPILAKSGRLLKIEGHTDSRQYGTPGYDNYDLGYDRANAVRHLLMQGGVTLSQIDSVDSYAATRPRVPDDPTHYSNRRVTVLIPFGTEKPKKLDGLPTGVLRESVESVFRRPSGR
ncbi:MAG TPA: flagellar motor protein MotB [Fimbriimonadaceae bacterium]|nr:flagellar motor protein MotB [Fimbriimonadaceae bacterium]